MKAGAVEFLAKPFRDQDTRRRPAYARGPLTRLRRLLATLVQAANDLRLAATTNIAVA